MSFRQFLIKLLTPKSQETWGRMGFKHTLENFEQDIQGIIWCHNKLVEEVHEIKIKVDNIIEEILSKDENGNNS